jgi:DNA-binding CsgD family transcriptional regulator
MLNPPLWCSTMAAEFSTSQPRDGAYCYSLPMRGWPPGTVDWRGDRALPLALAKLRKSVEALMTGRPAPPSVVEVQNAWGKFVLRAYPLETGEQTENSVVAVLIERHVPVKLELMHVMQSLPPSAKQKEVCLLLAEGASYRAVAERLSVRPNTVIDHVRKIYSKFDVRSHHELLSKLLQADPGTHPSLLRNMGPSLRGAPLPMTGIGIPCCVVRLELQVARGHCPS